jgi:hypothetical protein
LGFQSVDQEELEVIHQVGLYNRIRDHRSSSYLYPPLCDKLGFTCVIL